MMNKMSFIVCTILLTACFQVSGAPLDKQKISAEADWIFHVDCQQFAQTQVGAYLRQKIKDEPVENKLKGFSQFFGFHPLDDVYDITLYGTGTDSSRAAVLVRGNFNTEQLLALLNSDSRHQIITYGDYIIHSWIEENKKRCPDEDQDQKKLREIRKYGSLYGDDTVVLAETSDMVKTALDVLSRTAPNASQNGLFSDDIPTNPGVVIFAAADNIFKSIEQTEGNVVLKQTSSITGSIGEFNGRTYLEVRLKTLTEDAAVNVLQMVQGMMAFMNLAATSEHPQLAALLQSIHIQQEGKSIKIRFEKASSDLISILDTMNLNEHSLDDLDVDNIF
jgi:hypothetical protein